MQMLTLNMNRSDTSLHDQPTLTKLHVRRPTAAPLPRQPYAQEPSTVDMDPNRWSDRSVSWEIGVLIVALAAFGGVIAALLPYLFITL
ncbi:MAG: hypothetical protein AAFS10_20680 [Myxococcota bacterium]